MKNLINFFFSFDKLMKEKLILPFFWLAVIAWGMDFFATALAKISLGPLAAIVSFFNFFVTILFALVAIRLFAELAVAIFRINDNLSPDGGVSETADIDPMAEARKVAEAAAERAREVTKTAGEKTQAATKSARKSMSNMGSSASKTETAPPAPKATPSRDTAPKNPVPKSAQKTSATQISAKDKSGPKTLKAKVTTKTAPQASVKSPANPPAKKRGPKPGTKVQRDEQGRLLKKDGTLRSKPGPRSK